MKPSIIQVKAISTALALALILPFTLSGQREDDIKSDLERTFMPAIQMGYVAHGTSELSEGLMIQTSVEYRDISNFIFRINYDDFNSNMNLDYPVDEDVSFTGRTSFAELIGGIGYRHQMTKHNLTVYVQPGVRFYGYPVFEVNGNEVNLDLDSRNIGIIRYSIGYEYAITSKLFLTIEALASHTFEAKDFWAENVWSYGVTLGISAPLF